MNISFFFCAHLIEGGFNDSIHAGEIGVRGNTKKKQTNTHTETKDLQLLCS